MSTPTFFQRKLQTYTLALLLFGGLLLIQPIAATAQFTYLFGSLHSHSAYSDGNAANDPAYTTAASCYNYVKTRTPQATFWGISDHNHSGGGMSRPDYHKGVFQADTCNNEGSFLALYGMEWGVISTGGHVLIYGIDSLIGWQNGNYDIYNAQSDYSGLFEKVAARGENAFAYLAHMDGGDFGNILSRPYNATWDSAIVGMAIRSGPAFSTDTNYNDPPFGEYVDRFQDLLAKGYHVAPGFDHDNHYINFGRAHQGRTVVLSDDTTSQSLMRAFRSRRFYTSDDWNAKLSFTIGGNAMGSICAGSDEARIRVELDDPDNENVSSIKIWYGIPGNGVLSTLLTQFNGVDTCSFSHSSSWNSTFYYYTEITQADGHRIWSAPVWYTRTGTPGFELLSFIAQATSAGVQLEWSTVNEQGIDRYEIQRSPDGLTFNTIGIEQATGSTGTVEGYQWIDTEPLTSTRYYRLNIVDTIGQTSLSPIRRVDPELKVLSLTVLPSFATDATILLTVSHNREEPIRIEVFDMAGKLVLSSNTFSAIGTIYLTLDIARLQSGAYHIRVSNTDSSTTNSVRLVKG